jgi:hypothetical protein
MENPQINNSIDCTMLALVLWIICFWGEPDLIDALIHFLMK